MFSICCYASKKYLPVLEKTIPTWLNQKELDLIYLFTDRDAHNFEFLKNDKICLLNNFREIDSHGLNCSRKIEALWQLINYPSDRIDNIVLLDVDCLIVKNDLYELFKENSDIYVTYYGEKENTRNISSGFIALQKNAKTKSFMDDWLDKQDQTVIYMPSIDQISLTKLIKRSKRKKLIQIKLIPFSVYNNHPMSANSYDVEKWMKEIGKNKENIKILHLCQGLINNNEILNFIKENFDGI